MSGAEWLGLVGGVIVVLEMALRIVALGVIPGRRKPSTGMAWLLLILAEPILGYLIFLLFGRTTLGRRRHERQRTAHAAIERHTAAFTRASMKPHQTPIESVARLNTALGALPLHSGNRVDLIDDYRGCIAAMADAVDTANSFVHVEFYITAWDEVTDSLFRSLVAATERGVTVRLLFDDLGSRGIPGYQTMLAKLARTAIEWHPMLPIRLREGRWRRPDLRNHRKLLVVDGRVGFTGSLNLTEPGYNKPKNHRLGREWVELMMRVSGPTVGSLNLVFAADWYTETGVVPDIAADVRLEAECVGDVSCQVVPSGPGYMAENNLRMFTSLLYSATRRISLTSPHFVPDESLLYAVTTAAQRGINVELFVSEVADQFMVGHAQASYYEALLEAGVSIYQYPAPFILHAKHFTIDDEVAVIGSSNMDMRSFALNYEISVMLRGGDLVKRLQLVEDHYREKSTVLTMEQWARRPARTKYVDNVMRLTAALQ